MHTTFKEGKVKSTSSHITVKDNNLLLPDGRVFRCAVGRGGIRVNKVEGDGATPVGSFPIRRVLYRADRIAKPETQLPVNAINEYDAWIDQLGHPNYNQQAILPLPDGVSHERMWHQDHLYDLVVIMGYNDDPVIAHKGSAVFIHVARENYGGSAGCITLSLEDLLQVLKVVKLNDYIVVESDKKLSSF